MDFQHSVQNHEKAFNTNVQYLWNIHAIIMKHYAYQIVIQDQTAVSQLLCFWGEILQ